MQRLCWYTLKECTIKVGGAKVFKKFKTKSTKSKCHKMS